MRLDDRTIQLLNNFATINKSIRFFPGRDVATMTSNKTILARARIGNDIEREFAIQDLPKFLGVVRLFRDPRIEISEESVTLSEDEKAVKYTLSAAHLMETPPTKTFDFSVDVSFPVTARLLKEVKDAAATLSHREVVIVGEHGAVFLETTNVENPSADKYRVRVGVTDKPDFRIIVKIDNLRLIPGDYEVEVSFQKIVRFRSDDVEYLVAVEASKSSIPR